MLHFSFVVRVMEKNFLKEEKMSFPSIQFVALEHQIQKVDRLQCKTSEAAAHLTEIHDTICDQY